MQVVSDYLVNHLCLSVSVCLFLCPTDDATLIWGLHRDVVIAIGAGIVVVLVLIIVIAIVCRRAKRQEDVKTVSFAL